MTLKMEQKKLANLNNKEKRLKEQIKIVLLVNSMGYSKESHGSNWHYFQYRCEFKSITFSPVKKSGHAISNSTNPLEVNLLKPLLLL